MTRFSASYFIPAADLIWGILTLAQYKVTNVQQLYVFRFFIGAAGSLFFPAMQSYLGCKISSSVPTNTQPARVDSPRAVPRP
ncbi:hypothetical protein E5D57_006912 [Metarhizium anisopliae]|nr:hypothetical protein E5D57_006912 [Metarhizium anisopliae]